jgi:hypothetical protein
MNKNRILKMCAGACVGALIGFSIDAMVKHCKLNKAFDDAVDNKDLEEARKIEKEIKVIDNKVDTVLKVAIGVVSFKFACDIVKQIHSNREFNELNFTMTLCHILDTDESTTKSDKLDFLNKIIDSGKFGEKAIEILKGQIDELMEVK